MDFTLKTYYSLPEILLKHSYNFQIFQEYLAKPKNKTIILCHDVDLLPQNSLKIALIEKNLSITGSYFFRSVPQSFNEKIIKQIVDLGHEIGYHYEDLALAKGNIDKAYNSFCRNLEKLQKLYTVKTICMLMRFVFYKQSEVKHINRNNPARGTVAR